MPYLVRRVVFYLAALWAAISLNFLLPRLVPGNPVDVILTRTQGGAGQLPPEARRSLELLLGVSDASMWQQYLDYLAQLARGDFGLSVTFFPTPVSTVLAQSLPWTLAMVGIATMLSFTLGTLMGVVIGWRRGGRLDAVVPASTFLAAMPYFWLALVFLFVFSSALGLFPVAGGYAVDEAVPGFNLPFVLSAIEHGTLPAVTIVVSSFAGWMLGMRNMMVGTLSEDYVVAAEAKGLRQRRVMFVYAARNAMLPNVAGMAMALGFVVSGAILTEAVFSYPGVGFTLLQATQNVDYPLMQGIFLIITFAVLGANFLVDLVYAAIDPRIRKAG